MLVDKLVYSLGLDTKDFDGKATSADKRVDKLAGSLSGKLTKAVGVASAAFAAWKLGGFIKDATLVKARTDVLATVVEQVGKQAGYTEGQLASYEGRIKSLGITTQASRQLMVRFMQSQLDVADAAKIARAAQDLAVISGQNSSDAAETLTHAIVSQHPRLLRQYGIVADLNEVYSSWAATLGKSAVDLTQYEKKQSMLNIIMEQAARVAGTYEAAMGDVGKQLTSLPRYQEEFMNALGTPFQGALSAGVKAYTGLLKSGREFLLEQFDPMTLIDERLTKVDNIIAKHTPKVQALVSEYSELVGEGQLSSEQQERLADVIAKIGAVIPNAVTQWDEYGKALALNDEIAQSWLTTHQSIQKSLELLRLSESVKDLASAQGGLEKAEGDLAKYQKKLLEMKKLMDKSGDSTWDAAQASHVRVRTGLLMNVMTATEAWGHYKSKVQEAGYEVKYLQGEVKRLTEMQERFDKTGSTKEFILEPLKAGPQTTPEQHTAEVEAVQALSDAKIDILRKEGAIGNELWMTVLEERLSKAGQFSKDYLSIQLEMFETERAMMKDAVAQANKMTFGDNKKSFPTFDKSRIWEGFDDTDAISQQWLVDAESMFGGMEERGMQSAIAITDEFGSSFGRLFDGLGQDFDNLADSMLYGFRSAFKEIEKDGEMSLALNTGDPLAFTTGVLSLFQGIAGAFGGDDDEQLIDSLKNLEDAVRAQTDSLLGRTQATIEEQRVLLERIQGYYDIPSDNKEDWEVAYRNFLENAGIDTSQIIDADLQHFVDELFDNISASIATQESIKKAQDMKGFEGVLKGGEIDYSGAMTAIDYWVEMFDLTAEEELKLLELIQDIFTETGEWTFEQQRNLTVAIDRLTESIESGEADGGTQTFRSVNTITESQANLMVGQLGTLTAVNRTANSISNQILATLQGGSNAIGATPVTNHYTFYNTFEGTDGDSQAIASELMGQIRASGKGTIQ